jgi:hypothetical protein
MNGRKKNKEIKNVLNSIITDNIQILVLKNNYVQNSKQKHELPSKSHIFIKTASLDAEKY